MLGRVSKWMLLGVAGLLVAGLVGLGAVYAQGPNPPANRPANQAACPAGGGLGWRWGGTMPDALAEALGMTRQEIVDALRDGQTVAQLAEAKGLSIDQLVDQLLATREAALAEAVDAGRLTQAQADAMLVQMRENMAENLQNGTCTPGVSCGGAGACNGSGAGWGGNNSAPRAGRSDTGAMTRGGGRWRSG